MSIVSDKALLRQKFCEKMSVMYKSEVPLYGDMLDLVSAINDCYIKENKDKSFDSVERVSAEKHGAIRLGLPSEMRNMARLFAVMGMYPVGYYDLTQSGLPVHSTAFRPIDKDELEAAPFRVFTSLLRMDKLPKDVAKRAQKQLFKRQIFSDKLLGYIDSFEKNGSVAGVEAFVEEAVKVFKWHENAKVSKEFYDELLKINGLVADIVSFAGPHINHLTPRVLDIEKAHQKMNEKNLKTISTIQGPPKRENEILLRQTSFQALEEKTVFQDGFAGKHRARFGEIEQRGMALTPKGRELYDKLLAKTHAQAKEGDANYYEVLAKEFAEFPDNLHDILEQNLGYFTFKIKDKLLINNDKNILNLVGCGAVEATPITYEDFLPVSAAGIFKSNLTDEVGDDFDKTSSAQSQLESDMGVKIIDPFELYEKQQKDSVDKLGL